jgi:hypothetical protein
MRMRMRMRIRIRNADEKHEFKTQDGSVNSKPEASAEKNPSLGTPARSPFEQSIESKIFLLAKVFEFLMGALCGAGQFGTAGGSLVIDS